MAWACVRDEQCTSLAEAMAAGGGCAAWQGRAGGASRCRPGWAVRAAGEPHRLSAPPRIRDAAPAACRGGPRAFSCCRSLAALAIISGVDRLRGIKRLSTGAGARARAPAGPRDGSREQASTYAAVSASQWPGLEAGARGSRSTLGGQADHRQQAGPQHAIHAAADERR
jgi:hypothetical protein